ncbi:MAG: hypothetical protein HZB16_00575 [Armatimonadetes bacterium]|nr:hypothetical protein [Armatimonadota bacterium]
MKRLAPLVLLLAALLPARADDNEALLRLREGWAALGRGAAAEALTRWDQAAATAASSSYVCEGLARSGQVFDAQSAGWQIRRDRLLARFAAAPPLWLHDDTRDRLQRELRGREPGASVPTLGTVRLGPNAAPSGFRGSRSLWWAPLTPGAPALEPLGGEALPAQRVALETGGWAILDPRHADPSLSADRRARWRFDRVLVGYTLEPIFTARDDFGQNVVYPTDPWYDGQAAIWRLRFRLYYPSAALTPGGVDLREPAERAMDLLLRSQWLMWEYLGRQPRDPDGRLQPVDIWLSPETLAAETAAVAEELLGNIYLYRAAEPREPTEWFRQVAHELSHRALSRIGRYPQSTAYEPWLEGNVGERLLLRALHEQAEEPAANAEWWQRYRAESWQPLVDEWLRAPLPATLPPQALDTGDAGARWALGLMLWVADTHDAAFLRNWMRGMAPGSAFTGAELERSYRVQLAEQRSWRQSAGAGWVAATDTRPTVTADGLRLEDGQRVKYPVFLPKGDWALRLVGAGGGQVTTAFNGANRQLRPVGTGDDSAPALLLTSPGTWLSLELGGFGETQRTVRQIAWQRRR